MSENKFKAGDRVRIVADVKQPYNMWVEKGDTGVVMEGEHADGFECVNLDGCANKSYVCVENKYLETDATYDHKTAFLSELKGLLEKYDYIISSGVNFGEDNAEKVFQGISFVSSDESMDIEYDHKYGCITPDDIMDYDKE